MALANYQKITRVQTNQPFGSGADGALTISADATQSLTVESCSGTSGSTTLTTAGTTLYNGDLILIHQTRGTGVGQWEINKVSSGGGTTTLILQVALNYTYTDSGASQAQAIKIPQYTNITVDSTKTWTSQSWDGNIGGILIAAANGTIDINGAVSCNSAGFLKATSQAGAGTSGIAGSANYTGEGGAGASTNQNAANGNGGGGGLAEGTDANSKNSSGGGGGGNGTAGTQLNERGSDTPQSPTQAGGGGGATSGAADLTTMVFGGAGGNSGRNQNGGTAGSLGGDGAGIIFLFGKTFDPSGGTMTAIGDNGSTSNTGGGGGGAGGSVLIQCTTATLGTNLITATASSGGAQGLYGGGGGAGGVGIIAIHYGTSYTGTTNPTLSVTEDTSLIEG